MSFNILDKSADSLVRGNESGKLIQDIRERPFSVLLLDEVEKAAPSNFDALLTVLDEGILVDAFGRVTNFRNTIIILTTNLGASNRQSIGFKNDGSNEMQRFICLQLILSFGLNL